MQTHIGILTLQTLWNCNERTTLSICAIYGSKMVGKNPNNLRMAGPGRTLSLGPRTTRRSTAPLECSKSIRMPPNFPEETPKFSPVIGTNGPWVQMPAAWACVRRLHVENPLPTMSFPCRNPAGWVRHRMHFKGRGMDWLLGGMITVLTSNAQQFSSPTLCPIYMLRLLSAVCGNDKQLTDNSGCHKHNYMVDKWPWITNHQMMFLYVS